MNNLTNLLGIPKPSLSPNEKVLKGMEIFSEGAFFLVSPSEYETSPGKKRVVFTYLFGACDAFGQMHRISTDDTIKCFRAFLEGRFPSMDSNEREQTISFVKAATSNETLVSYIQAGGQSIVEWSRGNRNAPLGLKKLLLSLKDIDAI